MNLQDVVRALDLSVSSPLPGEVREVTGGYVSDLLSNVIASAKKGDLWVTVQTHANIVAVAVLKELAGIILVEGKEPAESTLQRAKEERIPILMSKRSAYEVAGKMYQLGIGVLPS